MIIDLLMLKNRLNDKIDIDQEVSFPEDYFINADILGLNNVLVKGEITLDHNLILKGNISGTMILEDSISLEEISYPFSTKIDEILEKRPENVTNTIDIIDVLWQNIMLEVPLQLTRVQDLSQYRGDGWNLVSEEEMKNADNPFKDLKDLLGEE